MMIGSQAGKFNGKPPSKPPALPMTETMTTELETEPILVIAIAQPQPPRLESAPSTDTA